MINETIKFILGVLIVIIVHELGHYLAFRALRIKPKIKFRWWGIEIGDKEVWEMKPLQVYIVAVAGILWGAIPLIIFTQNTEYGLVYMLMSMIDIVLIIQVLSYPKKYAKLTMLEITKIQIEEYEENKYKTYLENRKKELLL